MSPAAIVRAAILTVVVLPGLLTEACRRPVSGPARPGSGLPVRVEPKLIGQLGSEHIGNAVFRRGREGPRIAASGNRILEFQVQAPAPVREVVRPTAARYANGACVLDVNDDGFDAMVVGRAAPPDATDLIWFEELPGRVEWETHLIARVRSREGDSEKGFHDLAPFETRGTGGRLSGVVVLAGRRRLSWYERPADPTRTWGEHPIADLGLHGAAGAQSGLVLGDLAGNGRQDIACGNFWIECPLDPAAEAWPVHRYSDWDKRMTPEYPGQAAWVRDVQFGGMNQLDLGDLDCDGVLEIVAADAEIPEARLSVFRRDPGRPGGQWLETVVDTGLYCPHSLVVADADADGRPDILAGEMTAGGWRFPRTPAPRLLLYLNQGKTGFRKHLLHEGWGTHLMRPAPGLLSRGVFVFAADEIQDWYPDMDTRLVGWAIGPAGP